MAGLAAVEVHSDSVPTPEASMPVQMKTTLPRTPTKCVAVPPSAAAPAPNMETRDFGVPPATGIE